MVGTLFNEKLLRSKSHNYKKIFQYAITEETHLSAKQKNILRNRKYAL